jgi:hypothetical protein
MLLAADATPKLERGPDWKNGAGSEIGVNIPGAFMIPATGRITIGVPYPMALSCLLQGKFAPRSVQAGRTARTNSSNLHQLRI